MKLTDLRPEILSFRKKPNLGVAFDCPGECCADQRQLQHAAEEAEAQSADALAEYRRTGSVREEDLPALEAAARARHVAQQNEPYRIWVAWTNSLGYQAGAGEADAVAIIDTQRGIHAAAAGHDYTIDRLYTREGTTFEDMTVVEVIDRAAVGHARLMIIGGEVEVE